MTDASGKTVNERLFAVGLLDEYDAARTSGDLQRINVVLGKVGLRQDEIGMNWSLDAQD